MRRSPFANSPASDQTCMKNSMVRKALIEHGDDGSQVRHVLHFLYVCDSATWSETEMAEELRSHGFEVDLAKCDNGVIAEEYREVASEDFDSLTQSLTDLAESKGWTYDGFECAVAVAAQPQQAARGWGKWGLGRLFGR